MRPLALAPCFAALALSIATPALAQVQFEEQDGYVVMEMESAQLPADGLWEVNQSLGDYKGTGYTQFKGNSICNGPAKSPLRYSFRVTNGGVYELRMRASRIYHCVTGTPTGNDRHCQEGGGAQRGCMSFGEPNGNMCADSSHCVRVDLSNDAFVSIEDAQGNHVGWVGQNDTKVTKLFGGGNNAWRWTGQRALDPGGAKRNAHWNLQPGEYTLVVQGRSKDFRVDRMVLFDKDRNQINGAENLPETLATTQPPMDMTPDMSDTQDASEDLSPTPDETPDQSTSDASSEDQSPSADATQDTSGDTSQDAPTDEGDDGPTNGTGEACATGAAGAPLPLAVMMAWGSLAFGWRRRKRSV